MSQKERPKRGGAGLEELLGRLAVSRSASQGERPRGNGTSQAERPLDVQAARQSSSNVNSNIFATTASSVGEVDQLLATNEWQAAQPGNLLQHPSGVVTTGASQLLDDVPSLLASGWSLHVPSEDNVDNTGGDFQGSLTELDSDLARRRLSISSSRRHDPHSIATTSDCDPRDLYRSHGSQALSVAPVSIPETPRSQPSSRFSSSSSETGDEWSSSDEEEGAQEGLDSINLDSIIGRGAYGSVYKIMWKGQPAAVKVIEHDEELGEEGGRGDDSEEELVASMDRGNGGHSARSNSASVTQASQAVLEAAMSSAVCHPNVVQTYHYRTLESRPLDSGGGQSRATRETHIVMEYCDCGTLEDAVSDGRLADAGGADVDLEFLCLTLLEIAKAMEFLHKMHITHRDLKLANVLLKSSEEDVRGFTAKVSDFGLSRLLPDSSPKFGSNPEYSGTITHMAPELLQEGGMSRAADVYSYGILMWEALMGEPAYHGISKMQVMYGVVSEGLRPCFPPNTPKWYCQIASACWRKDPRRRPSFTKVCEKLEVQLDILEAARPQ